MKIAIIDNEIIWVNKILECLLKKYNIEDIDTYTSSEIFLKARKRYDVLLLEIEIESISGLHIRDMMIPSSTNIIFVSSHTEAVFDSFGKNVIGFVPKEEIQIRLLKILSKVEHMLDEQTFFIFKTEKGFKRFQPADIICFQLENREISLYSIYGKYKLFSTTISELEDKLINEPFFRISRSHLIHLHFIQSYHGN